MLDEEELEPLAGEEVVLMVVFVSDLETPAGEGFTMVVLCSVFPAGDAPGVLTVSVFCSHATSKAALAKTQIYFFIFLRVTRCGSLLNRSDPHIRSCP